jgi:eukaryotic-like serine/threonine-protein kinase
VSTSEGDTRGQGAERGAGKASTLSLRLARRWKIPLLWRVALGLLAVGLLPLGIAANRLIGLNSDALEEQVLRTHIATARSAADRVASYLAGSRALADSAAANPLFIDEPDSPATAAGLRALLDSRADLLAVILDNGAGAEVVRAQRSGAAARVSELLAAAGDAELHLTPSPPNAAVPPLLVWRRPLGKGIPGRLVAVFEAEDLAAAMRPLEMDDQAHLALFADEVALLSDTAGLDEFPEEARRQGRSASLWGASRFGDRSDGRLVAYSPVEGAPWFVISSQPVAVAEAVAARMRREAVLSIVFAVLLASALSAIAYASVIRPLRAIAQAQRRLAGRSAAKPMGDELTDLKVSLDALESRLKERQEIGEVFLDRYRVIELLGSGSMGSVFRGHDPVLNRPVALKTVRLGTDLPAIQRQRLAQLLLKEAVTTARFSHPNIVPVYDVVEANGATVMALEFVAGVSLEQWLTTHPVIDQHQGVPLGLAVARALEAAHGHDILHRDIKPGNILLGYDGTIKVTDFGIAETLAAANQEGTIFGTPGYLPPECLLGQEYDSRGDLFSLGVVLYRALTGEHPFGGRTLHERITRTVHQAVTPPRLLRPDLWPELDRLILELLQKDPAERPANASEVVAALEPLERREGTRWRAPRRDSHTGPIGPATEASAIGSGASPRSLSSIR